VSDEPGEVYVILHDDERIPCLVERIGENSWQATPARAVRGDELKATHIDVLPAGASLSFVLEAEAPSE
jgi:hypothetical protein